MNNLLKTTLIGLFFGTFGTTIGGIIGVTFKNTSKKFLSFVLAFASGLMISIVCFDLIPEAFNLTGIVNIFIGIMFGIVTMIVCDILVDKNLINIFTLTYPLQFIYYIFRSVFSTGANISKEKDKNKDAVMSGLVIGSIISLITFLLILINIDGYINFMNMDVNIYKTFTIYSVIEIFISLEFAFILNKTILWGSK